MDPSRAWQPLFTSAWGNKPPPTPRTFSYPGLGIEHQWATFHSCEITRVSVSVMMLWVFDGSITCSFSTGHHGAVKFYCFASVFRTGWKQHVEKAPNQLSPRIFFNAASPIRAVWHFFVLQFRVTWGGSGPIAGSLHLDQCDSGVEEIHPGTSWNLPGHCICS